MVKEDIVPASSSDWYQRLYQDRLAKVRAVYQKAGVDVRFIGSLGWAAALNKPLRSFQSEYDPIKDIDVMILSNDPAPRLHSLFQDATKQSSPVPFEMHFNGLVTRDGNSARIRYKSLEQHVDPSVFTVYFGDFMGIPIPTFTPRTLAYLTSLYGMMRPKDFRSLRQHLEGVPRLNTRSRELYKPFHDLCMKRSQRYPLDTFLGHLRWWYHTRIPVSIRRPLSHGTIPIWRAVIGIRPYRDH